MLKFFILFLNLSWSFSLLAEEEESITVIEEPIPSVEESGEMIEMQEKVKEAEKLKKAEELRQRANSKNPFPQSFVVASPERTSCEQLPLVPSGCTATGCNKGVWQYMCDSKTVEQRLEQKGCSTAPPFIGSGHSCRVGFCQNGIWTVKCESFSYVKALPIKTAEKCEKRARPRPTKWGCKIDNCEDNVWLQICSVDQTARFRQCGRLPESKPGCYVSDCKNGKWKEVCNNEQHELKSAAKN